MPDNNDKAGHRIQLRDPGKVYDHKLKKIIVAYVKMGLGLSSKSAVIKRLIDEEERRISA
jgi:hypothetical protein